MCSNPIPIPFEEIAHVLAHGWPLSDDLDFRSLWLFHWSQKWDSQMFLFTLPLTVCSFPLLNSNC